MNTTSRRNFLGRLGALGLGAAAASCSRAETGRPFDRPLGVQLYTLREQIPRQPAETLEAIAAIGFSQVEILHQQIPRLAPLLEGAGLTAVSGHFPAPMVTGDWTAWGDPPETGSTWPEAVETASGLGLRQMVVAYLQPAERGSLDFYRSFADAMNRAGELCRASGMRLSYHHHAFEFEPIESRPPIEILEERFDPSLVDWQLDLFWLAMAGLDPAEAIRSRRGRVGSLHLKDAARDAPQRFQESEVAPEAFVPVGQGRVDFSEALRAAADSGVRFYFLEQDQTAGDPLEALAESYRHLRGLRL